MELVTSIAEFADPIGEVSFLTQLSSCILECCGFVFDHWEADVILEMETELVPSHWFIIKVIWLFVQQALDHCFRVSISIRVAHL